MSADLELSLIHLLFIKGKLQKVCLESFRVFPYPLIPPFKERYQCQKSKQNNVLDTNATWLLIYELD